MKVVMVYRFLLKIISQVKGWSVTNGSKILQGYISPYDATVISRLRKHGLSPFGRANMDEFAMGSTTESSYYGATLNPHDSIGFLEAPLEGDASAVARGEAIVALGNDTGGSIRQPAYLSVGKLLGNLNPDLMGTG